MEEKYKAELKARDDQIGIYREQNANLNESIKILASRPIDLDVRAMAESESKGDTFTGAFSIGKASGRNVTQNNSNINFNEAKQTQSLAEAAAQIQQLLKQLSKNNPTSTDSEKLTVVARASEEIKNNPTLKAKVINALEAGGKEAFKETLDHPLVNILMATIEGWAEA